MGPVSNCRAHVEHIAFGAAAQTDPAGIRAGISTSALAVSTNTASWLISHIVADGVAQLRHRHFLQSLAEVGRPGRPDAVSPLMADAAHVRRSQQRSGPGNLIFQPRPGG